MKNLFYRTAFVLLMAVIFNSVVGATVSTHVFGYSALGGAGVANGVAFFAGQFMPKGCMCAGVLREIWTGEMIKAFRTPPTAVGWYDRVRSYDQYVDNDVIHFTEIGGDPLVLINNNTYPIDIVTISDTDKPISLDKFDTQATPITDDELHACSYDKMSSVQERHREAIKENTYKKAIHAYAPDTNKAKETPVLTTTGDVVDGRKKMVMADLIALKRSCDQMGMPQDGRILVLCPDHSNDLLETSKNFADHYNINETEGKITRLYGFDIYEYSGTPYYNTSTLKEIAFGVDPAATDKQASVAFYLGSMMKANGSVQFYYSEASQDPLYHRNLVNFRKWNIALPLKAKCTRAAIVSAASA